MPDSEHRRALGMRARTHALACAQTEEGERASRGFSRSHTRIKAVDDPLAIDERGGDARRDVRVPQPPNKLIRVIGKLTD